MYCIFKKSSRNLEKIQNLQSSVILQKTKVLPWNKFMKEVRGRHRDDHHLHIFSFYTIVYTVQVTDTK